MTQTNPYPLIRYGSLDAHDMPDFEQIAQYWTAVDEDLADINSERAQSIRANRLAIAQFDYPRTQFWHDPEGIDTYLDIPYAPDGGYGEGLVRGHLLDLYLPHSAILRGGNTMPVFIDIHGGGFTYGYKELNRNFCTHLASLGFAVFSLNYRLAPAVRLIDQLADIQTALHWISEHVSDWPISPRNIFLTGDSAGGALAWLTLLIESDEQAAHDFQIDTTSGLPLQGASLISPVVNMGEDSTLCAPSARDSLVDSLGESFFDGIAAESFLTPNTALASTTVPPVCITTSSDDFIEAQSLQLATALSSIGADFELDDYKLGPTQTLGHVYPVCLSWLPESHSALELIADFARSRCK